MSRWIISHVIALGIRVRFPSLYIHCILLPVRKIQRKIILWVEHLAKTVRKQRNYLPLIEGGKVRQDKSVVLCVFGWGDLYRTNTYNTLNPAIAVPVTDLISEIIQVIPVNETL